MASMGLNIEEQKAVDRFRQEVVEPSMSKLVVLDFWASWCGPCRRENPSVVRAYEKYKDQGFEVFSVSLDSDANRWRKAIEQDQLTWPNHVSDLQGWRNGAAREYGISSIPHTMLIDKWLEIFLASVLSSF